MKKEKKLILLPSPVEMLLLAILFSLGSASWSIKGMSYTGDRYCPQVPMGTASANQSLTNLQTLGANWVAIIVTLYQTNINTTDIFPMYNNASDVECAYYQWITTTDEQIRQAIQHAHSLGLKVLLKPHVDLIEDHMPCGKNWRGDIGKYFGESQWKEWFKSYTNNFLPLVALAASEGVEAISLNCELIEAESQSDAWKTLVSQVRQKFRGKLTVSTNWYPGPKAVDWWTAVDWIGVDAYYPLKGSSLEALKLEWDVILDALDEFRKKNGNKELLFTELGFPSGTGLRDNHPTEADLVFQATNYQALIEATAEREWFLGVHWWNWDTDSGYSPGDDCFTPQFKPASQVLASFYGGQAPNVTASTPPGQCIGFGKCTS